MTPLLAQRPRQDRAFERLYRRHVGDVYRYALAVLRNPADAEDVTQTTFMNAYRAIQGGEHPETPHNWLIAIAHNVCRQRFRQSARRPQEVAYDDDVGSAVVADEDGPSADDIRRALGHLAFNQRAALVMRELEGRSYSEIAEILDVSVSAVETLIFRARRALREQLEGSLTCGEAELAISKQLDGRLSRAEKGQLRAHLRECEECATFARRQRAQRVALRSIGAVPLPGSLASFFGGGSGATLLGGTVAKVAAVAAAGVVVAGGGYEAARHVTSHPSRTRPVPAEHAGASVRSRLQLPGAIDPDARPPRVTPATPQAARPATAKRPAGAKHGRAAATTPAAAKPQHPVKPVHPAQARGPKAKAAKKHPAHAGHRGKSAHARGAAHGRSGSHPHRRSSRARSRSHTRGRHISLRGAAHGRGETGGGASGQNGNGNGNGSGHGHAGSTAPARSVTNLIPTVTVPDVGGVEVPKPPKK